MSKQIVADKDLVAKCGLYCGACGKYLAGKCPGCEKNDAATWCKVRACCNRHFFRTCAECGAHEDVNDCGWFSNWLTRLIGFVFNSDRSRCIQMIRDSDLKSYAESMTIKRARSLPRRGKR